MAAPLKRIHAIIWPIRRRAQGRAPSGGESVILSQPRVLPDLTGQNLGTVSLLQIIGEGSMGVVYRGFQTTLSRPVAVKVVFRDRLNKLFTQDRFRQEAEVVANLMHPNVVTIFELGEQPDYLYFVMQLVDGISLSQ